MTLPDHCAMARVKIDNVPSPAFVMQARPPAGRVTEATVPDEPHPRPPEAACEQLPRDAFVRCLRLDEHLLDSTTCTVLLADGAREMGELLSRTAQQRDELIARVRSPSDRLLLRSLVRRAEPADK